MRILYIVAAASFVLTACSQDSANTPQTASAKTAAAAPAGGPVVIDHSRDEQEFRLRRSLFGVESMLEDYRAAGYDTADLETQQAELQNQLEQLLGRG